MTRDTVTVDTSTHALPVVPVENVQKIADVLEDLLNPANWFVFSLGQILPFFWIHGLLKNLCEIEKSVFLLREVSGDPIGRNDAMRLCNALGGACEQMLDLEDQMTRMQWHRLLILRGPHQRFREARETIEDVREAHLLALSPGFHDLVKSALLEAIGHLDLEIEVEI